MNRVTRLAFVSTTLLALVPSAFSQIAQLSPPALANDVPLSIVLVPQGSNLYAICSMVRSSRQVRVNVTGAPTVGTAVTFTRDQFCDAHYTPIFNGKLVTAHRFGGLRVWDATAPALPLTQQSFTNTNYSHEGLKTYKDFILYSEQHTSPSSQGGLEVYRMTSTGTVSLVGQTLFTAGAGNALEIDRTGRIVWQWGDRNNDRQDGVLRVYSTNGYTGNPILLNTVPHAYVRPYSSKDLERNVQGTNLLSAMGWDGLRAINVTNPTNPVINTVIPPTNVVYVDGVTFAPNTALAVMWGFVRIGTTDIDFIALLNGAVPGAASIVGFFPVPFRVDDIKVKLPNLYCVGRDRTNALRPIVIKI